MSWAFSALRSHERLHCPSKEIGFSVQAQLPNNGADNSYPDASQGGLPAQKHGTAAMCVDTHRLPQHQTSLG
jgi:hypothetical protein